MNVERIGDDYFVSRRGRTVRVSTVLLTPPVSYGVLGYPNLTYAAETIVWVDERIGGMFRYGSRAMAEDKHVGIVKRALRGTGLRP